MGTRSQPVVRVQVIQRAFRLIEMIAGEPEGKTLSELAKAMGLKSNTVHNILTTLRALNYLEQDEATGRYRCGDKLTLLGMRSSQNSPILALLGREMDKMVDGYGETSHLVKFVDHQPVIVATREGVGRIRVRDVGRISLHASATGKAYLSSFSDEHVRSIIPANLERFTDATITSVDQLIHELHLTRERGYATNRGEEHPDILGAAVCIADTTGSFKGVLTVELVATRTNDEKLIEMGEVLRQIAATVKEELAGYRLGR